MNKKIIFLFMFLLTVIGWQGKAQFTEDFEGSTFPPTGWTIINDGDANGWQISTISYSGSKGAEIEYSEDAHDDWLITPQIAVATASTDRFSFWAKNFSTTNSDTFHVKLSTTGTNKADFSVSLGENITPPDTWTYYEYDLSAYNGNNVYVAIQAISGTTIKRALNIDYVVNDGQPVCLDPSNLSVNNVSFDSAQLSWIDNNNGNSTYLVEWREVGANTWNNATTAAGATSYQLTGLSAQTEYEWQVTADCGGTGTSSAVSGDNFTTKPVNDNCSGAIALTVGQDCNYQTFSNVGATDSETGSPGCGSYQGSDVWFSVTVPASGNVLIDTNIGDISDGAMAAYSGDCANLTLIECDDDDSANGFMPKLELSGLTAGDTIYIRFWEYDGDTFGTFNICVSDYCLSPTNLSVTPYDVIADVSWTDNSGGSAAYLVEWREIGTTDWNGEIVPNGTIAYTITGLSIGTQYEWRLRSECSSDSTSDFVDGGTFTTSCNTITYFPYLETFEDTSQTRPCWTNEYVTGPNTDWTYDMGDGGIGGISGAHTGDKNARFVEGAADDSDNPVTRLVSPVLKMGSLSHPVLTFWFGQKRNLPLIGANNELKVYYKTASSSSWTEIFSETSQIDDWEFIFVPLPNPSDTYQIAFEGISQGGYANVVDDVLIFDNLCQGDDNDIVYWNGSSWVGHNPGATDTAILFADYFTDTSAPDFEACSLIVPEGYGLMIDEGYTITATKQLINFGEIYVMDKGSFLQTEPVSYVVGTGSYTTERKTTPYHEYDYTYFSSPSSTEQFLVFTNIGCSANYMWTLETANFNDSDGDTYDDEGDDWSHASGIMQPGVGYAILGAAADLPFDPDTSTWSNNNVDDIEFDGPFNTGDISVPVVLDNDSSDGSDNENLIGNPYPSAIDLHTFYGDNNSVIGSTFYFWTHYLEVAQNTDPNYTWGFSNANYSQYVVPTGGTAGTPGAPIPTQYVASAQGFVCEATTASAVVFKNSQRVSGNNSDFHMMNEEKDRIWLNMTGENGDFRQILLAFLPEASDDFDSYDGVRKFLGESADFYSVIEGVDKHISIQGMSAFDENRIVPLGMQIVQEGTYVIELAGTEGIFADNGQTAYLYDNYTNTIHNLSDGAYTFTSTEGSAINDRFEVRFTNNTSAVTDEMLGYLGVYPNPSGGVFNIAWKGEHNARLEVVDITGKLVISRDIESEHNVYAIDMSRYNAGVYFVKLQVNGRQIERKLILK